jgi:hypothetical protein
VKGLNPNDKIEDLYIESPPSSFSLTRQAQTNHYDRRIVPQSLRPAHRKLNHKTGAPAHPSHHGRQLVRWSGHLVEYHGRKRSQAAGRV